MTITGKIAHWMAGSILALAAALPAAAHADIATIPITGEHEYKAVRLTPQIYNRANPDLSDVLVLDENGQPVPYFIHTFEIAKAGETAKMFPLRAGETLIHANTRSSDFYRQFNVNQDILATAIFIQSTTPLFACDVQLQGSFDGIAWNHIQNERLYRTGGGEKLDFFFTQPLRYAHYRFSTEDCPLIIDGADLGYSRTLARREYFEQTMTARFDIEQDGNQTVVKLHGLKGVPLHAATFHTESQFIRYVSFANRRAKLFNYTIGFSHYQSLTLLFGGWRTHSDVVEIRIENGDNVPIDISQITLVYLTKEVVFKGENGKTYTLSFGTGPTRAPVYDIVQYKDLILDQGYDLLPIQITLSDTVTQAPKPEPAFDYTLLFNVLVVAVSLLLGVVIVLRLRRKAV